ncbi:SNF2/RAD54 family helicase [Halorubrum sp. E3]|nr:SNF2/RAD54 family helicase [Halorubrum sp. E3]
MSIVERAGVVKRGQTWRCNEANAHPEDVPEPHDVPLWEPHPRFDIVIDDVQDDYVEATVAEGNSHPRTPDFGSEMVTTVEKLTSDPRWSLRDEEGEHDA